MANRDERRARQEQLRKAGVMVVTLQLLDLDRGERRLAIGLGKAGEGLAVRGAVDFAALTPEALRDNLRVRLVETVQSDAFIDELLRCSNARTN